MVNLFSLPMVLAETDDLLNAPAGWERVLAVVAAQIQSCIPFGIYQESESAMCEHFAVSRRVSCRVTREVLARLHEPGTIAKDRASHWDAGQLSARMLDEQHELRRLVEPAAIGADEPKSWGWLPDPRLQGRVAMINDPVLDMIEAALAVEAQRGAAFADTGNLTLEEVAEVAEALIARKRLGHFRGFLNSYDDSVQLLGRGVVLESIFLPGVAKWRSRGGRVTVSTPVEGCRGWHADLCLSAACAGEQSDMAYAYLNWWMGGWAGASAARQGYYTTFPARVRAHLDPGEWEYWYEGQPAPDGQIAVPAGHLREKASHRDRMSRARVWNLHGRAHPYRPSLARVLGGVRK
ncbi:MAG: hypothetical protein H7245_24800 [Candidatus Saccharibacteria bacterium]|nr:hypothetical protein [Pseudorhodobacter sp.]